MERADNRKQDQLRPVCINRFVNKYAEGSVLIEFGETKVLCTASVEEGVPKFLRGSGRGWITAEYGMLPRSTDQRMIRESARGKQSGRTMEIQRLIGRSLRASLDLSQLGENTITLDCDVLQADGGTRTAAITGSWVALADALEVLEKNGALKRPISMAQISSVSVGIKNGEMLLDLDYSEDSTADIDMNFVMNNEKLFVEVQGTAEGALFSQEQMMKMTDLAIKGMTELMDLQLLCRNNN